MPCRRHSWSQPSSICNDDTELVKLFLCWRNQSIANPLVSDFAACPRSYNQTARSTVRIHEDLESTKSTSTACIALKGIKLRSTTFSCAVSEQGNLYCMAFIAQQQLILLLLGKSEQKNFLIHCSPPTPRTGEITPHSLAGEWRPIMGSYDKIPLRNS